MTHFLRRVANSIGCRLVNYANAKAQTIKRSSIERPDRIDPTAIVCDSQLIGNVTLGAHARVGEGCLLSGEILVGRYSIINGPDTDIISKVYPVNLGAFCSVARHVAIQESNHPISACSTYYLQLHIFGEPESIRRESKGPIAIGNDVWIGTQTIILSGATIGSGAIIGANSVVNGVIPPYAIAVGSPARVIRYRFDDAIIARLLELNWWDWPIERIKRNRALFYASALTLESFASIVD